MGQAANIHYQPRRGLSRPDAALYVGVGTSSFDKMVKDGTMPQPKKVGSRVMWDIRELDSKFDDLPQAGDTDKSNLWDTALENKG